MDEAYRVEYDGEDYTVVRIADGHIVRRFSRVELGDDHAKHSAKMICAVQNAQQRSAGRRMNAALFLAALAILVAITVLLVRVF